MDHGPKNQDTDKLIRRARDGDTEATEQLLVRHRERLRKMVAMRLDKRLAARVDPSDVLQEAMVDASRRLPEYLSQPSRPFYPWLRQIAWDRLIDLHRYHIDAEKRTVLREDRWSPTLNEESVCELADQLVASDTNPSRQMMRAEMYARVRAVLKQLYPHDRELLVLRHLEQLSVREIADVLGISESTVTTRHLRALQRLRRLLGDELGESVP